MRTAAPCSITARRRSSALSTRPAANSTASSVNPSAEPSSYPQIPRTRQKERFLPRIHPLIDLCNAISIAFAIPVAVFDVSRIAEYVEVRYAGGAEVYLACSGETDPNRSPEPT